MVILHHHRQFSRGWREWKAIKTHHRTWETYEAAMSQVLLREEESESSQKFSMVDRFYTKNMTCGKYEENAADARFAVGEEEIK